MYKGNYFDGYYSLIFLNVIILYFSYLFMYLLIFFVIFDIFFMLKVFEIIGLGILCNFSFCYYTEKLMMKCYLFESEIVLYSFLFIFGEYV